MQTLTREQRGVQIAKLQNQIFRLDQTHYLVQSQSGHGDYNVHSTELGWICECPDFVNRYFVGKCKHIYAVEFSQLLRSRVENQVVIRPLTAENCPKCKSPNVKARGIRRNKLTTIQRFYCSDCKYWFSFNFGFENMRASPQVISQAMQLYFTGESFRNIKKFLKLQGVEFSHQSVYNWIQKYVGLMDRYLSQITPQVSGTWRTDELYVKIKGNMKYLFSVMDDETRFWIAQQVADNKGTSDIRPLFQEAKRITGKRPEILISDAARNFHHAYRWEFGRPMTKHIQEIQIEGEVHNNKMERMNGEIRDREKTMRGLKNPNTPILKGMQIFHNFVRVHESLNGKTPAEVSGIKIEGENKIITLIQNSAVPRLDSNSNEPPT